MTRKIIKFPHRSLPRNDLMAGFAMDAVSGLASLFATAGDNLDISANELCGIMHVIHNALETGIIPEDKLK